MTDEQKRAIMQRDPRYRKVWGHLVPPSRARIRTAAVPAPAVPAARVRDPNKPRLSLAQLAEKKRH